MLLLAAALPAAVVTLTITGDPGLAAEKSGTAMVAVLRRDGIIIPFANWNGRRWLSSWPEAKATLDVPITLDSVPGRWWPDREPVTRWTAWPLDGEPREITVASPRAIGQHCDMNVGLDSDYRATEEVPPEGMQPYPKDGVATTGDLKVESVDVLDRESSDWQQVLDAMVPELLKAERKYYDSKETLEAFTRAPFEIEVLCRTAVPNREGAFVYYVEAVRRHEAVMQTSSAGITVDESRQPPRGWRGPRCQSFTIAQGWAFRDASGEFSFDMDAYPATCGRGGMVYGLPLGMLKLGGKLFWIMHLSGWGYERYEILDVEFRKVRRALSVYAGSC